MVSAIVTTRPKGIVQNILALTDKSEDTLRILYNQWLLEHMTSVVCHHMMCRDISTVDAGAYIMTVCTIQGVSY